MKNEGGKGKLTEGEIEVDNIGNLWYEIKNLLCESTVAGTFYFYGRRGTSKKKSVEKEL